MKQLNTKKLIIYYHEKGFKQVKIAELLEIAQSYVSRIITAYKLEGESALENKLKNNGSFAKLSDNQLENLKKLLLQPASFYGYTGDVWNKANIKDLILAQFGVSYHVNYISELMNKINFSSKKPIIKDYRQNEQAVLDYKEQTATDLKKKQN